MRRFGFLGLLAVTWGAGVLAASGSSSPSVATGEAPPALVSAARARDAAKAAELLSIQPRIDVNQPSKDGTTALHWAVYNDDVALVLTEEGRIVEKPKAAPATP